MRSRNSCSSRSSPATFSPSSVEPRQHLAFERADEQAALPAREQVAGVERHAGGRDRRRPVLHRLLHAGLRACRRRSAAAIIDAVADHRPAVVLARLDDVDLVAALRAVLLLPELAVGGIEGEALRVAVAIGPDLGQRAGRPTNGLSGGTAPSGVMRTILPMWLSSFCASSRVAEMLAERDEQIAVAAPARCGSRNGCRCDTGPC